MARQTKNAEPTNSSSRETKPDGKTGRMNKETMCRPNSKETGSACLWARLLCWTFEPPPDEAIPGDRPKINGAAFVAD